MKQLLIFFTLICLWGSIEAQRPKLQFDKITDKSGRSLGKITGIVQDTTGFMWFSTDRGLYRYDGYDYKLFKNNPKDSLSLPFNNITNLYYDPDGLLWMRHYDQYFAFENEKRGYFFDSITHCFFATDAKIVGDKGGLLWIGPSERGLMQYNPKTNKVLYFRNYPEAYSPKAAEWTNELIQKKKIAALMNIGNSADTSDQFTLASDSWILVTSLGEKDRDQLCDYGFISNAKGERVWEMKLADSRHPGGNENFRVQISVIKLTKGSYTLHFITDNSNAYGNWTGKSPTFFDFYGVVVTFISESEKQQAQSQILKPYLRENSIVSNQIRDMLIDHTGNVVMVTPEGIDRYNPAHAQFDHFAVNYSKLLGMEFLSDYCLLYEDCHNNYWIATNQGLIQYDMPHNTFKVYRNILPNDLQLTSDTIYTVYEDRSGLIWIGTENGLNILDRSKNLVYKYQPDNQNRLYDKRIFKFYEDRSGILWVATYDGLNRLKRSLFRFIDLEIAKDNQFAVGFDTKNDMWFHGVENKLFSYSRKTKTLSMHPIEKKYFYFDPEYKEYNFHVNDLKIGQDQKIWLAIADGVYAYDPVKSKIGMGTQVGGVIVGKDSIQNSISNLLLDTDGNIWAIAINGLYKISPFTGKCAGFIPYDINYESIYDVDRKFIKNAIRSTDGHFWFRTSGGIYVFKPETGKFTKVHKFSGELMGGSVSEGNIFEDHNQFIWFSSLPLLVRINPTTLETTNFQIENAVDVGFPNVTEDDDGILWIYTNNGLFRFDPQSKTSRKFSVDEGLADNSIISLIDDLRGHLWITTLKGLTQFDKSDEMFTSYFRPNDFESYNFLSASDYCLKKEGELLFFTTNGYVSYFPDSINKTIPPVVITRFTIFGREYDMDSLIYHKRKITLKYNQNFLGFEFSALDFTDPSKNKFQYFLAGLDKEWGMHDADDRKAVYPGLPPGEYTLFIKASNNDKIWNDNGTAFHIKIKPPWYRTIFAYILYIIIIVSSIISYIKYRERALQEEKRILEQKVKERTAEIEKQKDKIEEQKKNITDSIHYASRIQTALLPSNEAMKQFLPEHFVLFRPRDIVSGDFYWMTVNEQRVIVAAADCTGHGVPGAFMSMLGVSFLNEIVIKNGITDAHLILNNLRANVKRTLSQTGKEGEAKDGMDIALCVFDLTAMKLQFAGAYNPCYIFRNSELIEIKADRMPIGIYIAEKETFTLNEMDILPHDRFYIFSDGYVSQFGRQNGEKFKSSRLKELLTEIHLKPMVEQREILDQRLDEWRGEKYEQIDDVLVIGVKI